MVLSRPELQESFQRAKSWLNAFPNSLWFTRTKCSGENCCVLRLIRGLGRFFLLWRARWVESLLREAFLQLQTGGAEAAQLLWLCLTCTSIAQRQEEQQFSASGSSSLWFIALGVFNTLPKMALDGKSQVFGGKVDLQRNLVCECTSVWFLVSRNHFRGWVRKQVNETLPKPSHC